MSLTNDNSSKYWASCPKLLGDHKRRNSTSGLFNLYMTESLSFAKRYKNLAKLHSDSSALGLNAICNNNLPSGALFRSSLPATPLSTPIYPNLLQHFTEKNIRDLLNKSSTPKVIKSSNDFDINPEDDLFENKNINVITRVSLANRPQTLDVRKNLVKEIILNKNSKQNENKNEENNFNSTLYYSIKEESDETPTPSDKIATNENINDELIKTVENIKNLNLKNETIIEENLENNEYENENENEKVNQNAIQNQTKKKKRSIYLKKKSDLKTNNNSVQNNVLFVRNINYIATNEELFKFFDFYASVSHVKIVHDINSKHSKGFGFVKFTHPSSIQKILSMPEDEFVFKGRLLILKEAFKSKS